MPRTSHPAVIVDGRLCRLVEVDGLFSTETWAPDWRRWRKGGAPPVRVLCEGRPPTLEDLRDLGLKRVPK
jgi:hypothetical protein